MNSFFTRDTQRFRRCPPSAGTRGYDSRAPNGIALHSCSGPSRQGQGKGSLGIYSVASGAPWPPPMHEARFNLEFTHRSNAAFEA